MSDHNEYGRPTKYHISLKEENRIKLGRYLGTKHFREREPVLTHLDYLPAIVPAIEITTLEEEVAEEFEACGKALELINGIHIEEPHHKKIDPIASINDKIKYALPHEDEREELYRRVI